jgi:DNA-binding FadR family transcriptional regulator
VADQPRRGRRRSPAEAVADQLRRRILSGDVPDGGLLPKVDDLMAEFGVSRPAVSSACAILEPLCAQLCAERPDRERAVLPRWT